MNRREVRQRIIAENSMGKVLDVGYNQDPNYFLRNVDGFDINCSKKPSNYKKFYSEQQNVPSNNYHCIIMGEIIEHIIDLDVFMQFILRVLKKNGKLIITTPNPHYVGDIMESMFNKTVSDRGHIHSFSKHNLKNLLEHYNLCNIKIKWMYSSLPLCGSPIKINMGHIFTQKYLTICYKK